MTREPQTPFDLDAMESTFEARYAPNREASRPVEHEHAYARNGPVLACLCGETVTAQDADP